MLANVSLFFIFVTATVGAHTYKTYTSFYFVPYFLIWRGRDYLSCHTNFDMGLQRICNIHTCFRVFGNKTITTCLNDLSVVARIQTPPFHFAVFLFFLASMNLHEAKSLKRIFLKNSQFIFF